MKTVVTCLTILLSLLCSAPSFSRTLQGGVETDDSSTRLQQPGQYAPPLQGRTQLVDPSQFSGQPGAGQFGSQQSPRLGIVHADDFASAPPGKFDLGADRGSRELTLAWERWHHQLSREIYERWSGVADTAGQATVRIVVTRSLQIQPELIGTSGNRHFDQSLLDAIRSLNGNRGLTFPAGSVRNQVSMETDYIAGTDVRPGFSWDRNDYEHVRQNY